MSQQKWEAMTRQKTEARLWQLDGIPGTGSYEWRVAENHVEWSDGLLAIYGLQSAPTNEAAFQTYVHPDDRTRVEAETSAFLECGESYAHSFRIIRPDGQIRTIHDRGTIERAKDGTATLLRGVNFDTSVDMGTAEPVLSAGALGHTETVEKIASRAAGFGVYDFDIERGVAPWSRELLRIVGSREDRNTGSLETVLAHVHPQDRARVRRDLIAVMRQVGPYDLEYRVIGPGTETLWVRDRGETFGPIDPVSGKANRAIGAMNDITSRKSAEETLKSSNALLEALFANAPIGIAVFDRAYRFVRINDKLAAMNGLSIKDHIGKRPDEVLPDLIGFDAIYAQWVRILDTGQPWLDVEISGKTPADQHETKFWQEHFFPIADQGEIIGIAVMVEDITERKRAEMALRDSAQQLGRILDGTVGFVGILDVDGTVLEANENALLAAGLVRADVIGQKFWEAHWWCYDHAVIARLKAAIQTAKAGERVRYDARVRMKDDHIITIDFQLSPVSDAEGTVTHLIPSGFDISERNDALEHVRMLMEEVNHRSKNVLSLVQAIARQTVRTSPDEFLSKFSDRITALARAQDMLVQANWNRVDLDQLIRSQLEYFGDSVGNRIQLAGPAVTITADAAQSVSLVLHELATNAGKYGALSTTTGSVDILWSVDQHDDEQTLSLSWKEAGGPLVQAPSRTGFGSMLMTTLIQTSFGTDACVTYHAEGLEWRLVNGRGAIAT